MLDRIWSRNCRMGDLDGIIETGNRFLMIECKSPGKPIDKGQRLLLESLARLPNFTVLVIWGADPIVERMAVVGKDQLVDGGMGRGATTDKLLEVCASWWRHHNSLAPYIPTVPA
jgi:hypothetical protein